MSSLNKLQANFPIGVLDSGIGGLSVLIHLRELLPQEDILYFADQAHIPYGIRPWEQVRQYTVAIVDYLLARQTKLVVVACNTASAAALEHLRQTFPSVPIIGMEPAVKPAANTTRAGKVGVLATPGTFNSHRYANLMARFAAGIQVYEDPCLGLVERIEAGEVATPATRAILERAVKPMLADGVDTLVLGCTHYPFIKPLLQEVAGEQVAIIDPAPAVARHTRNVLERNNLLASGKPGVGSTHCFTSGAPNEFAAAVRALLGYSCQVQQVCWNEDSWLTHCQA